MPLGTTFESGHSIKSPLNANAQTRVLSLVSLSLSLSCSTHLVSHVARGNDARKAKVDHGGDLPVPAQQQVQLGHA